MRARHAFLCLTLSAALGCATPPLESANPPPNEPAVASPAPAAGGEPIPVLPPDAGGAGARPVEPPARADAAPSVQLPLVPPLELADGWQTLGHAEFERELLRATPDRREPSAAQIETLARALSSGGTTALRAALILGRTRSVAAAEVLIDHLELRDRNQPVELEELCARALGGFALAKRRLHDGSVRELAPDLAARLDALARGRETHPRWSARIECAASAVELGRRDTEPFLLNVLRWTSRVPIPADAREIDLDLLAGLQRRVARVLAAAGGIETVFEPYASASAREAEAARIGAALSRRR